MCTVLLLFHVVPSHPIVLAGNRDEFLDRKSIPPHVWDIPGAERPMLLFAGRDERAGGTWFGINQAGVIAGVTNRFTGTRDPRKASRGGLVLKCLANETTEDALACMTREDTSRYNPFNLFCLSHDSLFFLTNFPERGVRHPMGPGIYVLTNGAIDDPQDPKRKQILERLSELPSDEDELEARLRGLLMSHGNLAGTEAVCVHLPGYGTVSSSILFLGRSRDRTRFLYADGPPCEYPYLGYTGAIMQP